MKFIIALLVLSLVSVTLAEFECSPGVPYIENSCNTCSCTEKMKIACTDKLCTQGKPAQLRNCEVGSEWRYKCNDCVCDPVLKTICTNYPC